MKSQIGVYVAVIIAIGIAVITFIAIHFIPRLWKRRRKPAPFSDPFDDLENSAW